MNNDGVKAINQDKPNIVFTKVWKINHGLVIANTIEEAISTFKEAYKYPYDEIENIELVDFYGSMAMISKNFKLDD